MSEYTVTFAGGVPETLYVGAEMRMPQFVENDGCGRAFIVTAISSTTVTLRPKPKLVQFKPAGGLKASTVWYRQHDKRRRR